MSTILSNKRTILRVLFYIVLCVALVLGAMCELYIRIIIGISILFTLMITNKYRMKELEESNKHVLEAQALLESVYKDMPGGMIIGTVEEYPKLKFVSMGTLEIYGYTEEEFTKEFGDNVRKIIYEKDRVECSTETDRQIEEDAEVCIHHRILTKSGDIKWVHNVGKIVEGESGGRLYYCMLADITEYKLAEIELRRSENKLNIISEQSSGVIFEIDLKKKRIIHGEGFYKIFGKNPVMENFPISSVENNGIYYEDVEKFLHFYRPFEDSETRNEIIRINKSSGEYLWCQVTVSALFEDGEAYTAVGKITDIDAQVREKENWRIKAKNDPMTGLYNKMVTQEEITKAMNDADDSTNQVLIVMDLDDFKSINDNYGHLVGDEVLNQLAINLKNMFRRGDIVGRIGGDEFVVFLPCFYNRDDIMKKVKGICEMFLEKEITTGKKCRASVSVGVAFTECEKISYEELFRRADEALYNAKQIGKNCYCIYEDNSQLANQLTLQHKDFI